MVKNIVIVSFLILGLAGSVLAFPSADKFVRVGNYYLKAGTDLKESDLALMAKYDLLVLPAEVQVYNRSFIAKLRERNPDIILLAYMPVRGVNSIWKDSLHQKLMAGIKPEWYLRDAAGKTISLWPGTSAMNVVSGWGDYLANFVTENILADNFWGGVMYDEVDGVISFANGGDIDIDGNGALDDGAVADGLWRSGLVNLFARTREAVSQKKFIVVNGSSHADFWPFINGRIFESFPTPWEGRGRWQDSAKNYWRLEGEVQKPALNFIASDTDNTGRQNDYRGVRFGITSALLGNGFFGFDFGTKNHGQLWWYDEYDAYIGEPVGAPKAWSGQIFGELGVYRRDFKQGIVLINSSDEPRTVLFDSEYEHLHGTQDKSVNSGFIVSEVDLPPRDGVIFLRPLERVVGTAYPNGAFTRVLDKEGQVKRTGFFSYVSAERGGSEIIEQDVTGDGVPEFIVAHKGAVTVSGRDGIVLSKFIPFDQGFAGPLSLAVGNVLGDEAASIVVTPREERGGMIKVYRWTGQVRNTGFLPFGAKFKGGVYLALGDLDGDGRAEIVVGPSRGKPEVRIFRGDDTLVRKFGVGSASQGFGVPVAVAKLTSHDTMAIITGTGFGARPEIRLYSPTGTLINKFAAFDSIAKTGVRVAAADLDQDGASEILALTTNVFTTAFGK